MARIVRACDGGAVFPEMFHITQKAAALYAARHLGRDWRDRGYLIESQGVFISYGHSRLIWRHK